jgi:tRNA U38,U39,U40 pseudouridine synthase TruA
MVAIGQGTMPVSTIEERLVSLDRHQLPQPAPAAGLALIGVGYEADSVNRSRSNLKAAR